MIVRLSKYRTNFNYLKTLFEQQKPEDIEGWISLFSVTTNIPVIVVTWYVGEIHGFTDEIKEIIERLKKDYNYESIEE